MEQRGEQAQGELELGGTFLEALRDDVKALGGATGVGAWFIPERSQEAQRNYVNDRLSAARRDRFSDDQVELIMRRAVHRRGFSAAHFYLCDAIGTERPKPKDPQAQRDRALERFTAAAELLGGCVEDLKRLNITIPLRKVG
jgi:hypothetical protein